jgi:predicted enzyme related to lactoylglutathione lyase
MEKLSANTNALNWFELPMTDVERAKKFYETIFDIEMTPLNMMGYEMLMFPSQSPKIGGTLVKSPDHEPSTKGA